MPEKTATEFRADGWFITGDMAVMDESGRISIVGRAKDLIISGGFNVYPKEIEGEIDQIPGVKESAVIGLPHGDFGEGVTAVVVPDGSLELSESDILMPLQERLARFKQPKRIYLVPELPRNTMGKVQKALLRETYKDAFTG
jgi:malonyl-CoA/methylmalonyl-CoA synthetase